LFTEHALDHHQQATLRQRNLTAYERDLGPDHPDTVPSREGRAAAQRALVERRPRRLRPWRR
jgi:hypothetical protein